MTKSKPYDIIIIGAGPAGLGAARALADTGLHICVLEKQSLKILADPPSDGRDIALTHDTMKLMRELGMWQHVPKNEISPIKSAQVFSGTLSYALEFNALGTGCDMLGAFVPNNEIRRSAWNAVKPFRNIKVRGEVEVIRVETDDTSGRVTLANGEILTAALVVAADSRFSDTRRQMGIPVEMKDFGRTAIVCRMEHDKAHGEVAHECFFDAWTLAILPLQGKKSSIVITLPTDQAHEILALSPKEFNARIESHLGARLGSMNLIGRRHAYPLVATYAASFKGKRFVLAGDAAVGMHPVTAHGYNLGLSGAAVLAEEVRRAFSLGLDIGSSSVLDAYNLRHRRATTFIYYGTNLMVGFYTDNRPAALKLRALGLRLANHLPPLKRYVTRQLTGKAA